MAGIYIHIPFCKRKCVYCDFYSTAQFGTYSVPFLDSLVEEMEREKGFLSGSAVSTLYFGGGTPSLYPPADIGRIIREVRRTFDVSTLSEITLEANPEDLDGQYLSGLVEAGVNRLSIGTQSFDDSLLSFMRRRHDSAKAISAVTKARNTGFANISIDLIYGIPGMTDKKWERTLAQTLELQPEHISAYHLTFEPGTTLGRKLAKGEVSEIPDEQSLRQFETLHRTLAEAGYEHYEVSNFALPGYRSGHNSSYWTGEPYLGLGPGAHSFNGVVRRWCGMTVKDYVTSHPLYGSEELSPTDRYNELIMTSLRTADGIDLTRLTERCGPEYTAGFLTAARGLIDIGTLKKKGQRYFIAPEDFLISDNVISTLFI